MHDTIPYTDQPRERLIPTRRALMIPLIALLLLTLVAVMVLTMLPVIVVILVSWFEQWQPLLDGWLLKE
ncbi:hypothetical protein CYG49_04415 [Candidatus Saccharibacteria bacterium]|nr:MAG: hypothetical protein CYG49_04415 [Candidatus Saccharibacteria bacterium]